ncbi:MAG: hypothetical protein HY821_10415 [Acidobacteria bacterium]|nr:hypothetical protein [Acidobacteriota bacterium]
MTQLGEAIARFHRILDQDKERTAAWMGQLREQLASRQLVVNGRPVSPVLRPHFLTRRQYSHLVAAGEALSSAIDRVRALVLSRPQLMSRMVMLPAEKMLAAVDPGYTSEVAALLETHVNNGSMHLTAPLADMPHGVLYGEALADLFYDALPVKEFRKRYKLSKPGTAKPLLTSILKVWKDFGGKSAPNVAILDFGQPFATIDSHEHVLLAGLMRSQGLIAEVVSPDQLDYRNGVLRRGDLTIDVVFRGVRAHDFLMRYDLTHPLVRAYRDRKVCVVNSFRAEMTRKRALLALLSDESVTESFPAEERKAIRDTLPWTRIVAQGKTTRQGQTIDLVDYVLKNRASLILRPNDDSGELHSTDGSKVADAAWERALGAALRNPFVVQERRESSPVSFPVDNYGEVAYRDLTVDVAPHAFLGKVRGFSARLSSPQGGFSSTGGLAPTFVLESK